mmetsp:Transcript_36795/g.66147  ORF Transcript_36795/g.66147 Transcript_36795/m.66147 type:complete len:485 (+) Transcript_36795:144-1598(+)
MTSHLRNALLLGACYSSTIHSNDAFPTPTTSSSCSSSSVSNRRSTALHRSSNGFVPFSGDDNPSREYNGSGGGSSSINGRRPMDSPFSPMDSRAPRGYGSQGAWEEQQPPMGMNMRGQVSDRQSNLSRRDSSRQGDSYSSRHESINEDPRTFDMDRRYSQAPHPSMMASPHHQQQTRGFDGRIQGGSRHTYQNSGGQTFVETDGRPLDVEMELWEGPGNTPTRVKMYSEDGRQRPMNILTNNDNGYGGGGTMSVRNVGSMNFPMSASVSGNAGGGMNPNMGGPMGGGYGDYGNYGYGAPISPIGDTMMPPSGMRPHGMPMSSNHGGGYGDRSPRPSMSRGETVQGGSLKTFTLPSHVNAAQVTITSDGLPVNAKVELWGTSSHIKQLAEVYNDNGQTRPFAAILDVPGGENTIAVRNTGPMEYPIRVVVEPVDQGMGGMDGGMDMMGGGGDMMGAGYGPPMGGRGPPMGGYGPPMGGYGPPPPF